MNKQMTHYSITALATALAAAMAGAIAPAAAWAQDLEASGTLEPAPASDTGSSVVSGGYMRFDADAAGLQIWGGATHTLGGLQLASDIILYGTSAEFDVGPSFSFGAVSINPMVGVILDFTALQMTSLPVQFYTYFDGPVYVESWVILGLTSPFVDLSQDALYTRNFLLFPVTDWLKVGPHFELTYNLNETVEGAGDDGLSSLPVGLALSTDYGKDSTVLVFLGYETQADENHLTGRFTYIHNWGD
jgi:opacity protein-like surface antigen